MKHIHKTEHIHHTCDICGDDIEKFIEYDYDEHQNHCQLCGKDMCWQCRATLFNDYYSCKECAALLTTQSEQADAIIKEYGVKITSLMNERQGKLFDIMNQMKMIIKNKNEISDNINQMKAVIKEANKNGNKP